MFGPNDGEIFELDSSLYVLCDAEYFLGETMEMHHTSDLGMQQTNGDPLLYFLKKTVS